MATSSDADHVDDAVDNSGDGSGVSDPDTAGKTDKNRR